jgi:hypothetical protein
MTRETRYNLIFLAVILAILIPGGVKLFRKKLDPNATMMYLPDPVAVESAYIDSDQSNPRTKRIVPPVTSGWISQFTEQQWPEGLPWSSVVRHRGIVSQKRTFEAAASSDADGKRHAGLVLWNDRAVEVLGSVSATWGGKNAKVTPGAVVSVPKDVRHELQNLGYVRPPGSIAWIMVEAPASNGTSDDDALTLSFTTADGKSKQDDTIRLRVGRGVATTNPTTGADEPSTPSEEKMQTSPAR